jgi:hypothetical protein
VVLDEGHAGYFEVVDGLSAGERIAVEGVFFIKSALVKGDGEEG